MVPYERRRRPFITSRSSTAAMNVPVVAMGSGNREENGCCNAEEVPRPRPTLTCNIGCCVRAAASQATSAGAGIGADVDAAAAAAAALVVLLVCLRVEVQWQLPLFHRYYTHCQFQDASSLSYCTCRRTLPEMDSAADAEAGRTDRS
mmetsp:Transcript_21196/g.47323  ORF Transcript_21196/g.47323 Transcript_21196/m.47323 type:complete len:147 (+) Transcript_21196:84-524(+)